MRKRQPIDHLALAAAVTAAGSTVLYVSVVLGQDSTPASWVVVGLGVAAVLAAYGAVVVAPRRRVILTVSTLMLAGLGLAAILTIGIVILAGAVLALVAALRVGAVDRSGPVTRRRRPRQYSASR